MSHKWCDKSYVYGFFSLFMKRSWYEVLEGLLLSWYYLYSIEYISFLTYVKENMHFIDHGNFENWEIWVRNPQIEGHSVVLNEKFGIFPWWIIHDHYPPFNLKKCHAKCQIAPFEAKSPSILTFWLFWKFPWFWTWSNKNMSAQTQNSHRPRHQKRVKLSRSNGSFNHIQHKQKDGLEVYLP